MTLLIQWKLGIEACNYWIKKGMENDESKAVSVENVFSIFIDRERREEC